MAYSLNDVYRHLRTVMRVDGVVVGLSLGMLLAFSPSTALAAWGVYAAGPLWPIRMAGGLLLTIGVLLLLTSQERVISWSGMIAMVMGNAIIAIVLLSAYLQNDFVDLSLFGQLLLIAVFVVCLVSTLVPLNYLRAEYESP